MRYYVSYIYNKNNGLILHDKNSILPIINVNRNADTAD
ncbi:MAG: hypothetical protein H6Q20_162 [Bacteroidetes bacterium]|nr:hypothetical protein [Bacteroidota bacterium]